MMKRYKIRPFQNFIHSPNSPSSNLILAIALLVNESTVTMPPRNGQVRKDDISRPVGVTSTTGFGSGFTPSGISNTPIGSSTRQISSPFNVKSTTGFESTSQPASPPVPARGLPFSPSAQSNLTDMSKSSRLVDFYLDERNTSHQTSRRDPQVSTWSPSSSESGSPRHERSVWSPDSSVAGSSPRLPLSQSNNTIDSVLGGATSRGTLPRSDSGLVSLSGIPNPSPFAIFMSCQLILELHRSPHRLSKLPRKFSPLF